MVRSGDYYLFETDSEEEDEEEEEEKKDEELPKKSAFQVALFLKSQRFSSFCFTIRSRCFLAIML